MVEKLGMREPFLLVPTNYYSTWMDLLFVMEPIFFFDARRCPISISTKRKFQSSYKTEIQKARPEKGRKRDSAYLFSLIQTEENSSQV